MTFDHVSTPSPKLSGKSGAKRKSLEQHEDKKGHKAKDPTTPKASSPAPVVRAPNAKGQLEWDRQSISDLFQSYFNGSFKYQQQQRAEE